MVPGAPVDQIRQEVQRLPIRPLAWLGKIMWTSLGGLRVVFRGRAYLGTAVSDKWALKITWAEDWPRSLYTLV